MLIGQLAERTGTSERQLRYYERTGLLASTRRANGYRDYDETAEETVARIRALLAAGLPTKVIRQVLPCALGDGSLHPCPGVVNSLRTQLTLLDERADELARARRTLRDAIAYAEGVVGGS
ncbi:MerR family transcriptional regulator [Streptomyces sp. NPDC052396]|uniref:MerR family transcriptional regulator n=1 Tax=Streptomyces sp. NPDC052396 TaxID=3365689 RepID=UPI0037D74537